MRSAVIAFVFFVLGSLGCKSAAPDGEPDADAAFAAFLEAFERGNASLIRPLLADDVLLTAPDGKVHEGKDAALARFESEFGKGEARKRHRAQQTTHEDDIAAQIGFFDMKLERSDGRVENAASGTYIVTLLRGQDGRWRVQNFEWSGA